MMEAIFIATLGAEPQVVTLTLDVLLGQGVPITQVVVIHTDASREPIHSAVRLENEKRALSRFGFRSALVIIAMGSGDSESAELEFPD